MKYKMPKRAVSLIIVFALVFTILTAVCPSALAAEPMEEVKGESALLGELDSGRVLFEQDADKQIEPASTTKIMTAMLIIEAIERGELNIDEEVTALQSVIDNVPYDGSRVMPYVVDGEVMTVRDHLYSIMLNSDCVSCEILAQRLSGSVPVFVAQMNDRATQLGCTGTNFVNTHGYPEGNHYTTARDLFIIMRQAMSYDIFREIIYSIRYTIPATNKNEQRLIYNSNWLIWDPEKISSIYTKYYYKYCVGGKTGSSDKTGSCLVSCAEKDGTRLVAVITGANGETDESGTWVRRCFTESSRMFDWGFDNYRAVTVVKKDTDSGMIDVNHANEEMVALKTESDMTIVLPNEVSTSDVTYERHFEQESVDAPVSAGDVIGRLDVYLKGQLYGSVNLVAATDVQSKRGEKEAKKAEAEKAKSAESTDSTGSGKTAVVVLLIGLLVAATAAVLYRTNTQKIILSEVYPFNKLHEYIDGIRKNIVATRETARLRAERAKAAQKAAERKAAAQHKAQQTHKPSAQNSGTHTAQQHKASPQGAKRSQAGSSQGAQKHKAPQGASKASHSAQGTRRPQAGSSQSTQKHKVPQGASKASHSAQGTRKPQTGKSQGSTQRKPTSQGKRGSTTKKMNNIVRDKPFNFTDTDD